MKTVKYKFSQEFTYHGLSRWLTSYAILEPGDDPEQSAIKLMEQSSKIIAEAVKKQAGEEPVIQKQGSMNENEKIGQYTADLLLCTELDGKDGLLSYEAFVKQINNKTVTATYELMLKKLTK